ncbi:MAG: hypothetical protein EOM50_09285 [Erysipelotrichia bacterium]|nr:hypothetical protein [Erysipelotrichia bacterium]
MYSITPSDLEKISDVDVSFGTTMLLPKEKDIPEDFKDYGKNEIYFKIVNSLFYGFTPPDADIEFKDGFDPNKVLRVVRAHLASWEPKHQHKTAGVAYMLKSMCTIMPKEKFGRTLDKQ